MDPWIIKSRRYSVSGMNGHAYEQALIMIQEILSEQQLAALIPPSLRYLLAIAAHRQPRYLLRLFNLFDELYALLMLALERHYLQQYGGSFTENFYGLKRERVPRASVTRTSSGAPALVRETLRLRDSDIWKNLAILVGLPYLTRKLNEAHEIHISRRVVLGTTLTGDRLDPDANLRQRLRHYSKWFLRTVYPSIHAAHVVSNVIFSLAYLFDNSKYSSPLLWLIGTRIRRMSATDHRAMAVGDHRSAPLTESPVRPHQSGSLLSRRNLYPWLASGTRLLLPTSIFALKFLEWWHASDFARQLSRKATEGLELPPPLIPELESQVSQYDDSRISVPTSRGITNTVSLLDSDANDKRDTEKKLEPEPPISKSTGLPILVVPAPSSTKSSSTSGLCPICLYPVQTPTAVQTGYVFCYTCIFRWVDGSHERQAAFLEGANYGIEWEKDSASHVERDTKSEADKVGQTSPFNPGQDQWDVGKGRCAVTGRKVLGGPDGLRRLMV